jgi:fructose-1,6-bisphosphatase/inositol monophosphatase family enzyme
MNDLHERLRDLVCRLGGAIRDRLQAARTDGSKAEEFSRVAAVTAADTIYHVDKIGEDSILAWFRRAWPAELPVEVVMEGSEEHGPLVFPEGTAVEATAWKCIVDPIDGTRNLMYDKRAAWALAAVAPQRGRGTTLRDLVVAAMTELPTSKQGRADQFSAVRGRGRAGLRAEAADLRTKERRAITALPSSARDFRHGFAAVVKFFPEGKALAARVEEELWDRLIGLGSERSPLVFDDQYTSTGGQIHELLVGHDRMIADFRPALLRRSGHEGALCCHPYDICTALILEEAGGVVERPDGGPLDAPLDTTTPVAWVGFANTALADRARPHLQAILAEHGLLEA